MYILYIVQPTLMYNRKEFLQQQKQFNIQRLDVDPGGHGRVQLHLLLHFPRPQAGGGNARGGKVQHSPGSGLRHHSRLG
jgi:hypothetical protein